MTRTQSFGTALIAAAVLATSAYFAPVIAQGFMPWEDVIKMAAKHNGMVTTEDATEFSQREKQFAGFAPWLTENMKILDRDRDGMVSMEEIKVWMYMHNVGNDDLVQIWYRQAL